jgi:hypothetical protein
MRILNNHSSLDPYQVTSDWKKENGNKWQIDLVLQKPPKNSFNNDFTGGTYEKDQAN